MLLEFELWLHSVRDPLLADRAASRFDHARAGLAEGLDAWSVEFGFELPGPSGEVAAQVIALLLGAAFQYPPRSGRRTGADHRGGAPPVARHRPRHRHIAVRSTPVTIFEHAALDHIDLLEDTWADRVTPTTTSTCSACTPPVHWHDHPETLRLLGGHTATPTCGR